MVLVNPGAEASSLAEPLKAAEQALSGAEVGRDRAKLNLERTDLAPFNSIGGRIRGGWSGGGDVQCDCQLDWYGPFSGADIGAD